MATLDAGQVERLRTELFRRHKNAADEAAHAPRPAMRSRARHRADTFVEVLALLARIERGEPTTV